MIKQNYDGSTERIQKKSREKERGEREREREERERGRKRERGKERGERERKITSILRPSTSVPWSFSLAFSASALVSKVTKPKPCGTRHRLNRLVESEGHVTRD